MLFRLAIVTLIAASTAGMQQWPPPIKKSEMDQSDGALADALEAALKGERNWSALLQTRTGFLKFDQIPYPNISRTHGNRARLDAWSFLGRGAAGARTCRMRGGRSLPRIRNFLVLIWQ